MRIAYIHNIEIELDSRTQKEINVLRDYGHNILFLGWNKEINKKNEKKTVLVRDKNLSIENICIKVKKGKGLSSNLIPIIKYEIALIRWLIKNKNNFDVIHCCSFDTQLIAWPIAKIYKKKTVYDIYDDYADSHNIGDTLHYLIKKIDGYLIQFVDHLIICSEERVNQLSNRNYKKLAVIHNSPDIKNIDNNLFPIKKNNKIKIAYVGNLNDGRFVLELAQIISKLPEFEFHCGGDGIHKNELIELTQSCDNVFFYGRLSYEQVLSLESQCDIIPAIYDPSIKNHTYAAPNKFYEALYLGKPTIMVHNTGMDKIVDNYNTGETVSYDKKSISSALFSIKNNITFWKTSEKRLQELYKNKFSWQVMSDRLIEIYNTINE